MTCQLISSFIQLAIADLLPFEDDRRLLNEIAVGGIAVMFAVAAWVLWRRPSVVSTLLPVTLTLAGIAGFILSIGMAVDANVLIFARIKEELHLGRALGPAVEYGFAHAWPSIRDSNITTMITTFILYLFGNYTGTSIITGFALTLFIGVVVSMFSAFR